MGIENTKEFMVIRVSFFHHPEAEPQEPLLFHFCDKGEGEGIFGALYGSWKKYNKEDYPKGDDLMSVTCISPHVTLKGEFKEFKTTSVFLISDVSRIEVVYYPEYTETPIQNN